MLRDAVSRLRGPASHSADLRASGTTKRSAREGGNELNDQGKPLRVALLGCGIVGSEVYRLLGDQAADLEARIGAPLEVAGVAVRRPARARAVAVDPWLITTDAS